LIVLLVNSGELLVLRVDRGEAVMPAFCRALEESGAASLFVASAVGAFSRAEFGVFDIERDVFDPAPREGFLEVVSLAGNVVRRDGKPFAHIHAVCSNPDLTLFGGHLLSAECGLTLEVSLLRSERELQRVRWPGQSATYLTCRES